MKRASDYFMRGWLLLWLFMPASLLAAPSLVDPGQQFLEQEKRRKEQQLMEKPPAGIEAPTTSMPEEKKEGPCFPIHTIHLSNAKHLPKKLQDEITAPYLHTCMNKTSIDRLMHALNNAYIHLGYVTSRVGIDAQSLKTGTLELLALEGQVESIRINEGEKWKEKTAMLTAFPHVKGKVLQLKDLEQGLDQINRLPSNQAKLTLWPGETADTSAVKIENTPQDTVRFSMAYDNYGQEMTGRHRARATTEADNLLGLNDNASFHYIGSLDTNTLAMNASVPYGYWTVSVDSSYSEYLSVIDNAAEMFGQSYNTNLTLNRVVYRSKSSKTAVEAMLNVKESTRTVSDVILAPQPLTVARLGLTQLLRTESNVWSMNAHYSKGLTILGATNDKDQAADAPRAQFDKFDGGITLFQPLPAGVQLRSTLHGQYSFDSLYNSEQIILGDNSTVRGFGQSNSYGDSGLYMQNEFTFTLPEKWTPTLPFNIATSLQPYSFLDGGYTTLKTDNTYSPIIGAGAGVRFNLTRYLSSDLAVAVPLYAGGRAEEKGAEVNLMIVARW